MKQNELYHFGIKGMKWGVRRYQNEDGSLTSAGKKRYSSDSWNKNYSVTQRRRDQRMYSRGAVKRINKEMNRYGETLQGARSYEADRINSTRRSARVAGQIGSAVGATAGAVGGAIGGYVGSKAVERWLSKRGVYIPPEVRMMAIAGTSAAIAKGASEVGKQLGRYGGQSATMAARGYKPSKFR